MYVIYWSTLNIVFNHFIHMSAFLKPQYWNYNSLPGTINYQYADKQGFDI